MAYVRGVLGIGVMMGVVVTFVLACSGSMGEPMNSTTGAPVEVPPWACVPGETQPCPCTDDLEGLLTCEPDGSSFGECDCSPGAVSQGPPPTSGGTETGTGSSGPGGSTTAPDPTISSTGPEGSSTGPAGSSTGPAGSSPGPAGSSPGPAGSTTAAT